MLVQEQKWRRIVCLSLWSNPCAGLHLRSYLAITVFVLLTQSREELQALRKAQRAANREGWFESLGALAFSVEDMSGEMTSLSDRRAAEAQLQEEFMQQKQAILEKGQLHLLALFPCIGRLSWLLVCSDLCLSEGQCSFMLKMSCDENVALSTRNKRNRVLYTVSMFGKNSRGLFDP